MVLKWKFGHLVKVDLLPLKRISFSSILPLFDSTVNTLSRDIVHELKKTPHICRKNKKETLSFFYTFLEECPIVLLYFGYSV